MAIGGPPPEARLMNMVWGCVLTHMLSTAVEMGVFARLAEGPKSAGHLAQRAETQPDATYRLLRGLSALDVLEELPDRTFQLGPLGALLVPGPGSFAPLARVTGTAWGSAYLSRLMHSMKTGESAFRAMNGAGVFEWMQERPHAQRLFSEGMSTFSGLEVQCILSSYPFEQHRHVVDVGGAQGPLLHALLAAHSQLTGTLFDLPGVVASAEELRADASIAARCTTRGGDFFQSVPEGGDLYILKHVLHDWDDERALAILQTVARAMKPGATLMVAEQGIAPPGVPDPSKILDVIMLAMLEGGRERTVEEHRDLMQRAGLQFDRAVTTKGPIRLFLGRK